MLPRIAVALCAAFALAFNAHSAAAAVAGLPDLLYAGSGPHQAALVIDWNDGKNHEVIVWGYRWSGQKTAADALLALVAADPRLSARIDSATSFGLALYGLGYDTDTTVGFGIAGARDAGGNPVSLQFVGGISDMNTTASGFEAPASSIAAQPTDPADHYREGFFDNGFWELLTGPAGGNYPTSWTSSQLGLAGTPLVNGGWYALSITDANFNSIPPGSAADAVAAVFPGTPHETPAPVRDTTAPVLRVKTRIPGQTASRQLAITGTAADASGTVTLRVRVNQSVRNLRVSGPWRRIVRLQPGRNRLEISATDLAGNRSTVFRRVVARRTVNP